MLAVLLSSMSGFDAWACRILQPPSHLSETFWVHLEGECSADDLQKWAVQSVHVLDALRDGKSLDFRGVRVVGDIMLDQLPLQPIATIANIPHHIQLRLQQRGVKTLRVIPGALTIRDSQFAEVLATNLVKAELLLLGSVDISDTIFFQSLDLSRVIFAKPFVLNHVMIKYEGFFIGSRFEQTADFSRTTFGTHARFHKAIFRAPTSFVGVQFDGVAEFLEVTFEQAADFSDAQFYSGTGFSGSVFEGPADFSKIQSSRELYFRFSEFKRPVNFGQAQFGNVVDFSNSHFDEDPDFSQVAGVIQPDFTGSNVSKNVALAVKSHVKTQWFLFVALFLLVCGYLWFSRRTKFK